MADELTERLKCHARSFDSLLSLIPAKLYYGEDVSDQWKRKKQTPEQKRAAKMAKLDPDNWKSAKDIMDEREAAAVLKRKRDTEEEESDGSPALPEGSEMEQPKAVQDAQAPKPKRQKTERKDADQTTDPQDIQDPQEDKRRRKAEERAAKRQRKRERKDKAKQKLERQKAKRKEAEQLPGPQKEALKKEVKKELSLKIPVDLEATQRASSPHAASPSTASSEDEPEEVFSPQHESGTSSTSSIQPTSIDEIVKPSNSDSLPPTTVPSSNDHNDTMDKTPRERLQEAISQFRAERKADGGDGRPPKNRQELLEQRRRKEEAKKAAKKEQKRREKEEEARRQDEEIARHFSPGGSGSLLASPRSPMLGDNSGSSPNSNSANNFTFGRIAFGDGTQFDPSSTSAVEEHKKKGVRDTATELKLAEAKKARMAGLDEEKRLDIEQKDMWLNAKRRAHGEHVRDNTSLLKKALKRQQGQKKKSEREWNERLEGVKKAQDAKQKKRVENLAKRKEEKGSKKGKVKRPGFEGSFKGRTGGKRKS
ncbi:uncharacterized protein Z520_01514 [Fonsecaea multimorphosa CBS 102226]|uniref:Ribosomal RNA-processing protein 14/surfeit locus protein 6 C-terminal domain-containing protein n=1 Tax=Fonsecaea multimorphosa CBS 102226 TaxID=1442371 RepID=A0A0D2KAJ9_9EURO|nr:uncharacterized protein Z520_01514 [Fonsecaea multimorphosa CBS 102226]KIY03048.1 hypothetical protein Z520_01514 [Fonsecaea multimorphosa CBS 102226]OAL30543.1 hypothetical protein AYO22_01495 [Fonsecaea multimorphosa]